jgi:type IV pilus assembly protein PilE
VSVGSGYYTVIITVTTGDPATSTQPGYSIKATAVNAQASDTQCATFTVDQSGTQSSTSAAASTCWR